MSWKSVGVFLSKVKVLHTPTPPNVPVFMVCFRVVLGVLARGPATEFQSYCRLCHKRDLCKMGKPASFEDPLRVPV